LIWIGSKKQTGSAKWLETLRQDLLHKNTSNQPSNRFWARIAACHASTFPQSHVSIWFNAWKFDQEEQLWAALALSVIEQIKEKYSFIERIIFWIRLQFRRSSIIMALWTILRRIALPLLLGFVAWQYGSYIEQIKNANVTSFVLFSFGSPILWAGAFLSGLIQINQIVKDPFQISVKDFFDEPDYKEKIGFMSRFEADFARIVSLVTEKSPRTHPRKLVIFIDDLDRCEGSKAADIIEAINLFLDSPGCVFILGMDASVVAASIEMKYKDSLEKLKLDKSRGDSVGKLFLEKIVQIPFSVPEITKGTAAKLVSSLLENDTRYQIDREVDDVVIEEGQSQHKMIADTLSYQRQDILSAIRLGASLLEENPRQIKRFINLFRLYVYIANYRGVFEEYIVSGKKSGLSLDLLAVWTAWSIRWSSAARYLAMESQLAWTRDFLAGICRLLETNGDWLKLDSYGSAMAEVLKQRKDELEPDWCRLPWEQWLLENDFRLAVKFMGELWNKPLPSQLNCLQTLITLNRATLESQTK
jgi:hypothetical protein